MSNHAAEVPYQYSSIDARTVQCGTVYSEYSVQCTVYMYSMLFYGILLLACSTGYHGTVLRGLWTMETYSTIYEYQYSSICTDCTYELE